MAVKRKLTDFTPDDRNANKGTERGLAMLDDSLRKYGAGRSILVDKHGRVIAGNKTIQRAVDIGLEDAIVVPTDGKQLVVVQRVDVDLDSKTGRELAIADNRVGQVDLDFDGEVLAELANEGVDLAQFWNQDELAELLPDFEPETAADDPGAQIDRAEELQKKWQVKPGDVWEIPSKTGKGAHRLICGDSTKAEDVARAMGDAKPMIMITDPPYGVKLDQSWRDEALGVKALGPGNRNIVRSDDRADWTDAWLLFAGDVAYVWHADKFTDVVMQSLRRAGFEICQQIIWNKSIMVMGRSDYHFKHEPCWYAVRKGKAHRWIGDRTQTTVIDAASPNHIMSGSTEEQTDHPTQKPIECAITFIRNHDGDVYDPFLGSGTTLVACEQVGRRGFGIEIEPKYCAVILERLSQMGLTPKRLEA